MEPTSTLEVLSKEKIHQLFALIPLITFIIYNFDFWIVFTYTIFFSFWIIYIYCLVSFKKQSTTIVIKTPKLNKKMSIKESLIFLRKKLFFIPYLPLFLLTTLIIIFGFILSFKISIEHIGDNIYSYILFLAHLFLTTTMIFLIFVLGYYSKIINKNANNNNSKK